MAAPLNNGKQSVALTPARKLKIDAFGECERQLRLWKPQANPYQARYDELVKEFDTWVSDLGAAESTILVGKSYDVEVTPRKFKQTFSKAAVADAYAQLQQIMALDLLQFFTLTLSDAKAHLGKDWLAKWVPKLRIGARAYKPVPKMAIGKAA